MNKCLRLLFFCLAASVFAIGLLTESPAQKRDRFSHAVADHKKKDCSSCHTIPTKNWAAARGFPDVSDFPGHASCIGCHRRDFFAGNRPAICAGCHISPGPRGTARFPFPVSSRSTEFSTIFPHDVHQDLIAKNEKNRDVAVAHFVSASFRRVAADDKTQFNNCAICHKTSTTLPKTEPRINPLLTPIADAATENFTPKATFFKDSPSGHSSCFQCHFQGLNPTGTECAGCHRLEEPYFDQNLLRRYSLKFDHASTNHANKDCTTCHLRITQNADLRSMKDADVPILTCSTSSCHGSNILEEIGKRETGDAEKRPVFQCNYCHTPAIGRFPIPASHRNP